MDSNICNNWIFHEISMRHLENMKIVLLRFGTKWNQYTEIFTKYGMASIHRTAQTELR